MDNKLNVQKLGYEVGEPMWVHWDNRYVLRGGHILGKCPDENLITTEGCSLSDDVRYLDRDIETSTVGYFIEEDDKAIVLASSIYGINIPDSLCKDCMVIPKAYIKDITSIGTELVAQLLYFLQQRNYITEEQMNDACNEILKSN